MDVEHDVATVNGIRMHYVTRGAGPLLVLLHGYPQTWFMWRKLIGPLAAHHTVVAPDLRGYGLSDLPASGYDKRTMAADVHELVRALGHERVTVVGHDRGARVAHRYALDHPDEVDRVAVLDVVPTRAMFRSTDHLLAARYWHWFFHLQPDLPELLVADRVEAYVRYLVLGWAHRREALEEALPVYVEACSRPGAMRAGFDDYRAAFEVDLADDDRSYDAGERVRAPLLALWGREGRIDQLPVLDIWRDYAHDVRGAGVAECGHFLPEERPEPVLRALEEFLAQP